MNKKRYLKLFFGLLFTFFFIWLIFSNVKLHDIYLSLIDVSWWWVFLALLIFCVGYCARIQRWKLMLRVDNSEISWIDCSGPLLASYAINNILPFRLGDFARAFLFNAKLGVDSGGILATLLVERLLDLLMVTLVLLLALNSFKLETLNILNFGKFSLLALLFAIVIILNFPELVFRLAKYPLRCVVKFFPTTGNVLMRIFDNILTILIRLSKRGVMIKITLWSLAVWVAEGLVFWFIAKGMPSISYAAGAWLALPLGTLATLIPGTPGYVGTFDYFVIHSMEFFGNSIAASTTMALIVHVLIWFPPTILGGIYLVINSFPWKELGANRNV